MRRRAILPAVCAAGLLAACAGTPDRSPDPPRDRTADPEFAAAREAARPEFESQADALAAGVYEPFVHPDSVRPAAAAAPQREAPTAPRAAGDPSTEALLGTLDGQPRYDPPRPIARDSGIGQPADPVAGEWTLQVGAYATETGAFVRIGQIERDFPDRPRWYAAEGGFVRVYLGRFPDQAAAERFRAEAAARGYVDAFAVRAP